MYKNDRAQCEWEDTVSGPLLSQVTASEAWPSREGEMFCASDLCDVAATLAGLQGDVVADWSAADAVAALCGGRLVAVAYDADKDHTPFLRSGHGAHWALLVGFAAEVGRSRLEAAAEAGLVGPNLAAGSSSGGGCEDSPTVCATPPGRLDDHLDDAVTAAANETGLYFVALHGKSRHLALWPAGYAGRML